MTAQELTKLGINYDPELKVVFHWSKHRGWVALKPTIQNVRNNIYYMFKHEGKTRAIREEVIVKAFTEPAEEKEK